MSYFNTTLKRNSKLDLSRADLLKLASMLEGELQAREVVIAVLKSEQIKKFLNPHKQPTALSGFKSVKNLDSFSSKMIDINPDQTIKFSADPLSSLSRDSFDVYDPSFDYSTTLALYNIKMYQLENLINNQKQLRNKYTEQLKSVEMRYEKVLQELEEEKLKKEHLESEFKDYDRVKLENEIKSLSDALNENKTREKEIILSLLNERKHLIIKLIEERHQNEELKHILTFEKGKIAEMVEGLEDESKRSLQMEAELEKYLNDFESERNNFNYRLQLSESKNTELTDEVERLKSTIDNLQKQLCLTNNKNIENIDSDKWNIGEGVRSSIVTMPVNTKVHHSLSSVTPVSHPKVSVAQPVTKSISSAKIIQEVSPDIESKLNTILPPPSIPVPQPKQIAATKKANITSVTPPLSIENHNVINKPTDDSINENEISDAVKATEAAKNDNSVKQNIMFYEKSANQSKLISNPATAQPTVRKTSSGARIPPPVPPNKPSIKPVLPSQAILHQNKIKDLNKPLSQVKSSFASNLQNPSTTSNTKS